MKEVSLFQAVNGLQGARIEPILCEREDACLGPGYYFWVNDLEYAKKWGKRRYKGSYAVYKSTYDAHSNQYFDLAGDPEHVNHFKKCYTVLKEKSSGKNRSSSEGSSITVAEVLAIMKTLDPDFRYLAVRACLHKENPSLFIPCETGERGRPLGLTLGDRFQMCVFDLDFLLENRAYREIYSSLDIQVV